MLQQKITPQEASELKKIFDKCKNVVIIGHQSPDGDAIGSTLALYEYLTRRGKTATVIVPNYFPDFLKWMHDADKIVNFERQRTHAYTLLKTVDLICCLDFNVLSRIGDMAETVSSVRCKKVLIDHHIGPETQPYDLVISRPECSSTCELLFRVILAMGETDKLNLHAAQDIYAGMFTDTGGFAFNSKDPDIFIIIAELLRKGIDKDRINRNILNYYTADRYRLMGYILYEKLEVQPETHSSFYVISREELSRFNYLKGDLEGVVNMPLAIRGQKLSISLREDTEKPVIWVSIRSYDDFSAKDMAERFFNGGGHFNAAGGRLECMTVEEAAEHTRKAIEFYHDQLA